MKKCLSVLLAGLLVLALAACGSTPASSVASSTPQDSSLVAGAPRTAFRIAGLKGPTSMGAAKMVSDANAGTARHDYTLEVYGTPAEVLPAVTAGEVDVAMIPANVAATWYSQGNVDIQVAAINTLGVLYVVETGNSINSIEDLRGKTIYSTGQGSTPQFAFEYILRENGIDPATDVTIEYKSESAEVAALLAESDDAIAVLPQPFVTVAMAQNDQLRVALDLTAEWDKVSPDSALVTGVLVARTEFIEQNPEAFAEFLQDYKASIEFANQNPADAAVLIEQLGIFDKAAVVEKAIPNCNLIYIDGAEMQTMLTGYLQVLFEAEPKSVGGAMPGAAFFYGPAVPQQAAA